MAQHCTDLEERRRLCFALALKEDRIAFFAGLRRRLFALPFMRFLTGFHHHA
jgi:hypothetical protein